MLTTPQKIRNVLNFTILLCSQSNSVLIWVSNLLESKSIELDYQLKNEIKGYKHISNHVKNETSSSRSTFFVILPRRIKSLARCLSLILLRNDLLISLTVLHYYMHLFCIIVCTCFALLYAPTSFWCQRQYGFSTVFIFYR